MHTCREGVLFLNNNRIIPSDFRIWLLLEMPIPSYYPTRFRFITTWWLFFKCYGLYLKVPLSTSWPLRRTWMPSLSREPKAMYSPRAQSTVLFLIISPRPFRIRLRPVCEGKTSVILTECMNCVHIYLNSLGLVHLHELWSPPRVPMMPLVRCGTAPPLTDRWTGSSYSWADHPEWKNLHTKHIDCCKN